MRARAQNTDRPTQQAQRIHPIVEKESESDRQVASINHKREHDHRNVKFNLTRKREEKEAKMSEAPSRISTKCQDEPLIEVVNSGYSGRPNIQGNSRVNQRVWVSRTALPVVIIAVCFISIQLAHQSSEGFKIQEQIQSNRNDHNHRVSNNFGLF